MKYIKDIAEVLSKDGAHFKEIDDDTGVEGEVVGIRAQRIVSYSHDMSTGFPINLYSEVNFDTVVSFALAYILGCDTFDRYDKLGLGMYARSLLENQEWNTGTNKGKYYLGRLPGVQARSWVPGLSLHEIDQIGRLVDALRMHDQRSLVNNEVIMHYNPAELDRSPAPLVTYFYKFKINDVTGNIDMYVYDADVDIFGVQFLMPVHAFVHSLVCQLSGTKAGVMHHILEGVYVMLNDVDATRRMFARDISKKSTPTLKMPKASEFTLENLKHGIHDKAFKLVGYAPHPAII